MRSECHRPETTVTAAQPKAPREWNSPARPRTTPPLLKAPHRALAPTRHDAETFVETRAEHAGLRPKSTTPRYFGLTYDEAKQAAKRLKGTYGAPEFSWQKLRRTCATYLTNAPGIFGGSSAYRSARQLGHAVGVAERHYLGVVKGISREARTLEGAMGIEGVVARVRAAQLPGRASGAG